MLSDWPGRVYNMILRVQESVSDSVSLTSEALGHRKADYMRMIQLKAIEGCILRCEVPAPSS